MLVDMGDEDDGSEPAAVEPTQPDIPDGALIWIKNAEQIRAPVELDPEFLARLTPELRLGFERTVARLQAPCAHCGDPFALCLEMQLGPMGHHCCSECPGPDAHVVGPSPVH